ncbi:hypothetical protein KIPB_014375, partial [Kipferlia bialata]|eukprot:g14375.t1
MNLEHLVTPSQVTQDSQEEGEESYLDSGTTTDPSAPTSSVSVVRPISLISAGMVTAGPSLVLLSKGSRVTGGGIIR